MKTNEKQRCPKCDYLRIGRLMYCPKCGNKYENEIPLKNHPATYKRCLDCKFLQERERYGYECKNPKKVFSPKYSGCGHSKTTKACKYFEEKI